MGVEELKQYRSLRQEIEEFREKIRQYEQCDTVRGSDPFFPYLNHTMKVAGRRWTARELSRLEELVQKCGQQYELISAYIDSIEDSETRRIFRLRYLEGDTAPTWVSIAMKIGGNNTPDGVRKVHDRFLARN